MRKLVFAFAWGLGCGTSSTAVPHHEALPPRRAPAAPATPIAAEPPPPPRPPPFALLASPGEMFMLVIEDGRATCQRWEVAPGDAGAVQLRHDQDVLDLAVTPGHVALVGRARPTAEDSASTTCSRVFAARSFPARTDGGPADLDVEGAQWFARRDACEDARARHRRVATNLASCDLEPFLPEPVRAASRARLDRMLARGGTMYTDVDGTCRAVRIVPARRATGAQLEGSLITEQRRGRRRTVTSYGYQKQSGADEITLLGPSTRETAGGETTTRGLGCADVVDITAERDTALGMYFTRERCRAVLAAELAAPTWYPDDTSAPIDPGSHALERDAAAEVEPTGLPFAGC